MPPLQHRLPSRALPPPRPLSLSEHRVCPLGSAGPPCSARFCLSRECRAGAGLCGPLSGVYNGCFFLSVLFRFLVGYGGSCFFKAKMTVTFKILSWRQIHAFLKIPCCSGNLK